MQGAEITSASEIQARTLTGPTQYGKYFVPDARRHSVLPTASLGERSDAANWASSSERWLLAIAWKLGDNAGRGVIGGN